METNKDKNDTTKKGFSQKPYSKMEPVTNHDAGLTNDNEELYGTPQNEKPLKDIKPDKKPYESGNESDKNATHQFVDEEDIVGDTNLVDNNDPDCFDKQYGKDSIPKPEN
ncbi:hypothetical protein ACSV4D_12435 [Flavobacterium sp. ARAG 55.4]|uniref:hypothetical protein n=1 Tax=Flavobacterium sp. ARAG 55.4 TaxID=3451357 RepID=UPI003F455C1F